MRSRFLLILQFIFFISIVLSVFTMLQWYFFSKLAHAFPPDISGTAAIVIVFIFSYAAPFVMNSPKTSSSKIAAFFAWAWYIWLGFLFYFLVIGLISDLVGLFVPALTPIIMFLPVFSACIAIMGWGIYRHKDIMIKQIEIKTKKLPAGITRVRAVQLSDIHFSHTSGIGLARKIVSLTNSVLPDLILFTGDMIDRGAADKNGIANEMAKMDAALGKFACTGNHEFYMGIANTSDFIAKSGFKLLRNSAVSPNGIINIAGVDDITAKRFDQHDADEAAILKSLSSGLFTILLKHQPRIERLSAGFFDLQLSGHTHAGQIFPFSILTSIFFKYVRGLHNLENGSALYVSAGTGTWGPPARILARAEVTVIDITAES